MLVTETVLFVRHRGFEIVTFDALDHAMGLKGKSCHESCGDLFESWRGLDSSTGEGKVTIATISTPKEFVSRSQATLVKMPSLIK